jgi:tRNA1Val (adenine37-N6)-methyltransferase
MLAQRFPQAKIDAVELDKEACAEAQFNVKQSPWANRLQVIESSFQEHAAHCSSRYDLIISNPPYYRSRANISIPDQQRSMARHDHALPFAALLSGSAKLLSNDGSCWFILPVREAQLLLVASKDTGLHLVHTKAIRPKASKEVNRLIMAFARQGAILKNSELVIYNEDGSHTQAYYELTKDFYLWEKQP